MYKLEFSGEEGKKRFVVCHQAVVLTDQAPPLDWWTDVAELLKLLKEIGSPDGMTPNGIALYDLAGDSFIHISGAQYKHLLFYINRPIWRPDTLENVLDTVSWLSNLVELPALAKV